MVFVRTLTCYRLQRKYVHCTESSGWRQWNNYVEICILLSDRTVQTAVFCTGVLSNPEVERRIQVAWDFLISKACKIQFHWNTDASEYIINSGILIIVYSDCNYNHSIVWFRFVHLTCNMMTSDATDRQQFANPLQYGYSCFYLHWKRKTERLS